MKHIREFTRRQAVLAALALAVLAIFAVVPWRVVAQEAKPKVDQKSGAVADSAVPATAEKKQSPEQLLVGTWRMGKVGGKLTFRKDGTFHNFAMEPGAAYQAPSFNMPEQSLGEALVVFGGAAQGVRIGRGLWKFENGRVTLRDGALAKEQFKIARLDDTFLRLTPVAEQGADQPQSTAFYVRVKDVPALDQLGSKAPPRLVQIAKLAGLDGEDVLALAEWYKTEKLDTLPWDVVERAEAFRDQKIGHKALFKFTDEEDNAYAALMKLAGGRFTTACALADQGLLAPEETAALKKMKEFQGEWQRIGAAVDKGLGIDAARAAREELEIARAYGGDGGGRGRGNAPAIDQQRPNEADRAQHEALTKLKGYLDVLFQSLAFGAFTC